MDLADLLLVCIERIESEGPHVLDEVCAAHPEHANALRDAVQELLDCGLAGAAAADGLPATLDDYELVRELGRGGMGVVYEARQTSLGRTVALKVLREHLLADAAAIERFRREANTVAGLQHRGIVQVHATGLSRGRHFLAMEFVDGTTLDKLIAALRARPAATLDARSIPDALRGLTNVPATAVEPGTSTRSAATTGGGRGHFGTAALLIAEVADALAVAHERGIVHRDVKPSNVLLRRDGTAVLNDFGLARREDLPAMTQTGAFAGTPFYASPEQAAGAAVDPRSDLFALGATLYELVTLHLPFEAGTSAEVLHAIRHREPTDPRRYVRSLPRDLLAILQRALEKDPRRRYADATAFAADLRAFAGYRPVVAQPISTVGRAARWARRQPWQALLAATLVIGIPVVTTLGIQRYRDRERLAAAERNDELARGERAVLDGFVALGDQRFGAARTAFALALRIDPANAEAWIGDALAVLDRDPAGTADWLARFRASPTDVHGMRALRRAAADLARSIGDDEAADAGAALGPPQDALESFWEGSRTTERVMATHEEARARRGHEHLLDAVLGSPTARPAFHYALAVAAGEARDAESARRVARAMQALWPDTPATWVGSGLALHYVDPEAAAAAYRRALELDPELANARNNLGNVLWDLERDDEAMAVWRDLLERQPDYATPRGNLGRALFYHGELEAAREELDRAFDLDPELLVAAHYYVWTLQRLERFEEAVAIARRAVAARPDAALVHRDLVRSLSLAGRSDAAVAAATAAVEANPDDAATLAVAGDALFQQGAIDAACDHYRRRITALGPGPDSARAREEFAFKILENEPARTPERLAEARAIADALVDETGGKDPWLVNLQALACVVAGDAASAADGFDRVVSMVANSDDPATEPLYVRAVERRDALWAKLAHRTTARD